MASLRTHNNNARRAQHRKDGRTPTFRMGRCPTAVLWPEAEYYREFGVLFKGYRTYRDAHK